MSDPRADALLALKVLACEDAYDEAVLASPGKAIVEPSLDIRLAVDYIVTGVIVATDSLLRKGTALTLGPSVVFYGWLLRSKANPSSYVCLIRGTAGAVEWAEDAEGEPISVSGLPGKVERGFYGIYSSMRLRRPGSAIDVPLVSGITGIVGTGTLTVAGHSLGAALATYLTTDLSAGLGKRVVGRFYCSPHPGDGLYAQWADARIGDYRAYADGLDIVTHVPPGYCALPRTTTLCPDGRVRLGATSLHHVLSLAWLLCPEAIDLASLPPIDQPYIDCLRVPKLAA